MMAFFIKVQNLFQPEETSWRAVASPAAPGTGVPRARWRISLKAVFWCGIAILTSLGLGNLS